MKISLTLNEFPLERLSALAAFLAGSAAAISNVQHAADDDDASGDTPATPGQFDKTGLPWDERIHSTPGTLTAKQVWRAKRGVDKALIATVEAELRQRAAGGQIMPPPVQQQPAYTPPPVQQQPAYTPPPVQQQPAYTPPPPMPQPGPAFVPATMPPVQQPVQQPQQQAGPVQLDWVGFMQKLQQHMQMRDANGGLLVDAPYLATVVARVNQAFNINPPAQAITDFQPRPECFNYATQIMAADGRWYN